MKAGKEHRVPLSDAAVALLRALPRHVGTNLVFVGKGRQPVSDSTMSKLCRDMGVAAVPHGFRSSTFKDWARSCTAYPDEVSELALAHVASDATRAAYARDELLPKRKAIDVGMGEIPVRGPEVRDRDADPQGAP
jgi:integrase